MAKSHYEVLSGKEWTKVSKASEQSSGWLHFEIWEKGTAGQREVTIGLAQPANWRKIKPKPKKEKKSTYKGIEELFRF